MAKLLTLAAVRNLTPVARQSIQARRNIDQDYLVRERSFFVVLDHYRLLAVSRSDRGCKADHVSQIHAAEHIANEGSLGMPERAHGFRPGSFTDRISSKYRELTGTRDQHCESERNDAWIRRSDELAQTIEPLPNSDSDRLYLGVSASLRCDRRRGFGSISSGGAYRHRGDIYFSLSNGLVTASAVHHMRSYYGAEEVSINIHTSLERMEWLHSQLKSRPEAKLGVRFRIAAYQNIASPDTDDRDIFYVKRDTLTPIADVSFRLADEERKSEIINARTPNLGF